MNCKKVPKKWGSEWWLHNDDGYCCKYLFLDPGFTSSLHYHKDKEETFMVMKGQVQLEVLPFWHTNVDAFDVVNKYMLEELDFYTLRPNTPHRFTAIGGKAVVVEASTKHDDNDVYRLEDSKKL